jgi:hypothetical protein
MRASTPRVRRPFDEIEAGDVCPMAPHARHLCNEEPIHRHAATMFTQRASTVQFINLSIAHGSKV